MIKTWLMLTAASILVAITLLIVNLMVFTESTILADYLKQRMKIILADSCANDVFENLSVILDNSISISEGDFSILRKNFEKKVEEFESRTSRAKNYCGIQINLSYDIHCSNQTSPYMMEIYVNVDVNVKDSEGLFSLERSYKISRTFNLREKVD